MNILLLVADQFQHITSADRQELVIGRSYRPPLAIVVVVSFAATLTLSLAIAFCSFRRSRDGERAENDTGIETDKKQDRRSISKSNQRKQNHIKGNSGRIELYERPIMSPGGAFRKKSPGDKDGLDDIKSAKPVSKADSSLVNSSSSLEDSQIDQIFKFQKQRPAPTKNKNLIERL